MTKLSNLLQRAGQALLVGGVLVASLAGAQPVFAADGMSVVSQAQQRNARVNDILQAMSAQLNGLPDPQLRGNELALSLHKLGAAELATAADFGDLASLQAYVAKALRVGAVTSKSLGDSNNMVFVPMTPCRIADSRLANNKLTANAVRGYYSYSAPGQGGNACASNPILPAGTANALAMTVTATQAAAGGWLTVTPDGSSGTSSALNFLPGVDIANSTVVQASGNASSSDFYISAAADVHVVVDLLGYYAASEAAALECTTTVGSPVNVVLLSTVLAPAPACASGYTQTATFCQSDNNGPEVRNVTAGGCTYYGALLGNVTASSRCCRVPGR